MTGKVITVGNMKDEALATLGIGLAIIPDNGEVVSPLNGTVAAIFPTKHAIGLAGENGAELIIHIGLDTVKLDGRHFRTHVKAGDRVKTGQLLLEFDIEAITNEGYSLESPVMLTNPEVFANVNLTDKTHIATGAELMSITFNK